MNNVQHVVAVAMAAVVIVVVVEMVRRRQMRGRFGLVWIPLALFFGLSALFPVVLQKLARFFGVAVPLNLAMVAGMVFILVMLVQLSYEVGRLEDRNRLLAEQIAILRSMIETRPDHPPVSGEDEVQEPDDGAGTERDAG